MAESRTIRVNITQIKWEKENKKESEWSQKESTKQKRYFFENFLSCQNKRHKEQIRMGSGYRSVIECLSAIQKVLRPILSTTHNKRINNKMRISYEMKEYTTTNPIDINIIIIRRNCLQ
jgi:hypothetical protein